jgi:hypothetical protein
MEELKRRSGPGIRSGDISDWLFELEIRGLIRRWESKVPECELKLLLFLSVMGCSRWRFVGDSLTGSYVVNRRGLGSERFVEQQIRELFVSCR